jgi:carbon monoxide dehydrogenase subunit G
VRLGGEHRFAVRRARLWEALVDPTILARVLPGIESLEATGPNAWRAAMTMQVGPVKGRFTGSLELSDLVPPESYRLKLDGSGPAGFLRGSGAITLAEESDGSRLGYALDAQVGGKLASVGQRLVESSGRALARQGLEGLERELAARQPAVSREAGAGDAAPAPTAPPSQAAFAARFARGLWGELPASWRWGAILVALAALAGIALLLRGC